MLPTPVNVTLSLRPDTLHATAEDVEHGLYEERHAVGLPGGVKIQARRVIERRAGNRDSRPGHGQPVVEVPEVRGVGRILERLDYVHPGAAGVVVPAEDEGPVIDFRDAGDRVWNLFAGLLPGSATPVIHEDLPVHLLYGEALGRYAGGHGVAVGRAGRPSIARELPGVKGTLDAIPADAAVGEVSAKVRAER